MSDPAFDEILLEDVDDAGAVQAVPVTEDGFLLTRMRVVVPAQSPIIFVHVAQGAGALTAGDPVTFDDSTTAADPPVPSVGRTYTFNLEDGVTKVAFRTNSGDTTDVRVTFDRESETPVTPVDPDAVDLPFSPMQVRLCDQVTLQGDAAPEAREVVAGGQSINGASLAGLEVRFVAMLNTTDATDAARVVLYNLDDDDDVRTLSTTATDPTRVQSTVIDLGLDAGDMPASERRYQVRLETDNDDGTAFAVLTAAWLELAELS